MTADERKGKKRLLSIPYSSPAMKYSRHRPNITLPAPAEFSDEEVLSHFSRHQIPGAASFVPEKMEIREQNRKGGKGDTRRIVILGNDKLHYKVLKFAD